MDECELCGYRVEDGTFRDRMDHLRKEHPAYARGVLLRVIAPFIFIVELMAIAVVHGSQWVYLVALFSSFGALFIGKQTSRAERRKSGARPVMPMGRLLREGGIFFLMIVPIIALLITLAGRR